MCVKALDSELALNFSRFQFVCLVTRRVQLFATPWTAAHQAPLSMGIL